MERISTIYDVAQRADVSIATVSRVLRGHAPVSDATRRRVLDAVADLRFTPSRLGRSLAERRHAANGIVFPHLAGPYFAEVVLGYEEAAGELGRSVLILSTHGRQAAPDMVLDLAGRVDGLVVLGRTVGDEVVGHLAGTGLPLVLLARPAVEGVAAVTADNTTSAAALARHLLGHGYTRLAFLGDPDASPDVAERWQSLSAAVAAAPGAQLHGPVRCGFDEQAGRAVALRVLQDTGLQNTGPQDTSGVQALVCANDELALGAVLAAETLGLRIPDDVAVTGWDDVMAARYTRPALTTVRQPMRDLGSRAAHALHALVEGQTVPPTQVLPTQLVVRASCGRHQPGDVV